MSKYSELDNVRSRQTNNTYFILDLPELPTSEEKSRKLRYKAQDNTLTDDVEEVV